MNEFCIRHAKAAKPSNEGPVIAMLAWPVVPAQAVTDVVYGAIRDRILRGELGPGLVLRQEEISRAMGVSRTPVREALMRLVSDGYVQRLHRRGFRVAGEPIQDLVLLYPILAALERLACASALRRITAAHVARLDRTNDEIRQAVERGDAKEAIALNQQFHRTLCEPCDNPRLVRLLDDLSSEVMRLEIWSFSSETDREQTMRSHDEIIAALRQRNVERVLTTLERDRLSAYTAYREQLTDASE
jgi:DNA-binding GntR family transcriptional regulator